MLQCRCCCSSLLVLVAFYVCVLFVCCLLFVVCCFVKRSNDNKPKRTRARASSRILARIYIPSDDKRMPRTDACSRKRIKTSSRSRPVCPIHLRIHIDLALLQPAMVNKPFPIAHCDPSGSPGLSTHALLLPTIDCSVDLLLPSIGSVDSYRTRQPNPNG